MFLTLGEIDELLAFVRKEATRPLVYAMFVFAAHTEAVSTGTSELHWGPAWAGENGFVSPFDGIVGMIDIGAVVD